jgi:hypothetical protein
MGAAYFPLTIGLPFADNKHTLGTLTSRRPDAGRAKAPRGNYFNGACLMMHRSAFRLSCAVLAALVVGCDDDGPSGNDDPGLEVDPPFAAVIETDTLRLSASLNGQPATVSWDVQHDSIATVTPDGLVTGLVAGFTAVTATQSSPQQMRSASITVTAVTALTSGTGVNISTTATAGSRTFRKIAVPAGATSLAVSIVSDTSGRGNVDLFVRRGRIPSTTVFDCASQGATNNELCTIASPAAGTWYILARSSAPYSGARLTATVTP